MTVTDANSITDKISFLRENVYNTDTFISTFISDLQRFLKHRNIYYIKNQDGGLDITIELDPDPSHKQLFSKYTKIITDALNYAIKVTMPGSIGAFNMISNLVDIIIIGDPVILVRL